MIDVIHTITPGDHFSPRTGSAIPTVVHGLARASAGSAEFSHFVLVESSTFQPRYDSAAAIEYQGASSPSRIERYIDGAKGLFGGTRTHSLERFRPLAEALAERAPGIVIAHNATMLPSLLREQHHRVILYAHNAITRSFSKREAERALGGVDAIVCVSRSLAGQLTATLPPSIAARVRLVPNGVDTTQFTPRTVRADGPLRVMFVGRVVPEKGADIVLRASRLLHRTDYEVSIVGSAGFDGSAPPTRYERRLRELTSSARVPVRFIPFTGRTELPELLREADILVVPSTWKEPSALTVGEGLATGLVVIGSDVGGIPEVLGEAGLLVRVGDPRALAQALDAVMSSDEELARLKASARAHALDHDWEQSWQALSQICRDILVA